MSVCKSSSVTFLRYLGALFLAGALFFFSLPFILSILSLRLISALFSWDARDQAHGLCMFWARLLFRFIPFWRLEMEGLERLPQGPFVLIANHRSALDVLALAHLKLSFRWLAKASIFRFPLLGWALSWVGYVPVERGDAPSGRRALRLCAEHLRGGRSMLFFPEGTRSLGAIKAFKVGAFKLALEAKVPLVPVLLRGTEELLPKGSLVPRRGRVQLKVLDPIFPREGEEPQELAQRAHAHFVRDLSCFGNESTGSDRYS